MHGKHLGKVVDMEPDEVSSLKDLIPMYKKIYGFMASHLVRAYDILVEALEKADVLFLSFTGNLIATGLRGAIRWLVERRFFDVVITTCGALDHDIARSYRDYYGGFFEADDRELHEKGIHRLGNIFVPVESYGRAIEDFVKKLLLSLKIDYPGKTVWAPSELVYHAGRLLEDEKSVIRKAYENNIPIFVPGIADGAFGSSLMFLSHINNIKVDVISDLKKLADIAFNSKTTAALIIGGGISKHHTLWWNQFKDGLDYAVYITTAVEYDGSLSGAHPREAISWGKISTKAKSVVVYADATLVLPLLVLFLKEAGISRRH